MNQRENDFSQGSVKRLIISQAVPLTLAQAVQLLYNVVDRIYIGHLENIGGIALTGLGITFPVIVIIAAFTSLFSMGGTTLFSIARGKGENEEAKNIIGNVFCLLVLSSVILFVLCYLMKRELLFLFGASEESFFYANQYLEIYLYGTAFSMLGTGLNTFINAQGFPRIGMITTIIGAVINIVLDPIFIFSLNMGVKGAAIATVISRAVSAVFVIGFLTSKKALLRLEFSRMKVTFVRLKSIVGLGLPGFVVQGTNSLVQITCNTQLQQYGGDLYVGIMTVLNSVREMVSLPVMGISHGAQPILGFNYGAKKPERVKEGIRFTAMLGMVYTLAMWIVVMVIPKTLMSIFSEDITTITVGAEMLNIYFFGFVFMAFQFAGQTAFQALGKAKQAIFFSLFRKVIIVVPLTVILPMCGLGVEGVFWAEPVSNAVGGLAAFSAMWIMIYRKL
ncbi:MAG: MATE family efflux transporter [Clostridia bacterium]|nr:MATE family efflux transporter [Clostridia bacterium]